MSHRSILALSAAVSAFLLVIAGGVATYALRAPPSSKAPAADSVPVDVVRAREAELQRRLDEANARLRGTQEAVFRPAWETREGDDDHDDEHRREHREHHEGDDG